MNQVARLWRDYLITLPSHQNMMVRSTIRQAFIAGAEAMRGDMNMQDDDPTEPPKTPGDLRLVSDED